LNECASPVPCGGPYRMLNSPLLMRRCKHEADTGPASTQRPTCSGVSANSHPAASNRFSAAALAGQTGAVCHAWPPCPPAGPQQPGADPVETLKYIRPRRRRVPQVSNHPLTLDPHTRSQLAQDHSRNRVISFNAFTFHGRRPERRQSALRLALPAFMMFALTARISSYSVDLLGRRVAKCCLLNIHVPLLPLLEPRQGRPLS